jgi:hypothetical protein
MKKTVVVLTTRGKKGNQETNEFIEHIINIWECFEDRGETFPSFFIIPYRNRKIRPEVCLARYEVIKRNDHTPIV